MAKKSKKNVDAKSNSTPAGVEAVPAVVEAVPSVVEGAAGEASEVKQISMKELFSDLLNRETLYKFISIFVVVILTPLLMQYPSNYYGWSAEQWGIASVLTIQLFMGIYLFFAFLEERRDYKNEVLEKKKND